MEHGAGMHVVHIKGEVLGAESELLGSEGGQPSVYSLSPPLYKA